MAGGGGGGGGRGGGGGGGRGRGGVGGGRSAVPLSSRLPQDEMAPEMKFQGHPPTILF